MSTVEPPRAARREWVGLAVIALPCLLYSMDLTVLNVAIPELSADLQPSSSQLLWIIDIYGFMVAGFLITMGTLGDRIGRRKLLLIGAVAFGAGSLLAAFSTSAEMLIVARALLGVAGATLAPSTLSLIFNMFHDPQQRTFAIGVWIASYSAGAVIGPVVGGGPGLVLGPRQPTLAEPMLDLDLFRIRAFSASLAAYGLSIAVMFGAFVFILQHLQLVLGLSPLEAGLWMVPSGIAFIVAGMLTPQLVRRVRPGFVMGGGLALGALGFVLLAQVDETTGVGLVVAALVVFSIGVTPVITLATDLIVGSAPPERSGAASGISETGAEFGGAVGIAVLGSIGVAVYRGHLEGEVPPSVPPEQAETAQDTLGGATEVAAELPDAVGAALLETAQEAFALGLRVTAVVGAVVLAGLAVVTAYVLRHARTGGESVPEAVAAES